MRKLFLTAALATLLVMPVLAQFPMGGRMGRGMDANMLLSSPDVQKDLKLSDDVKKSITEAREVMTKAIRAAFQDKDREAMQKATTEYGKAISKVKDGLSEAQKKRLMEIEVQLAAKGTQPNIFQREEVQKALKFTAKQKEMVKEVLGDLEKDVKEVMEDAKGDREKFFGAMKKVQTMGKDTFDKIAKSLTEDQKSLWKALQGEPFEGKVGFGGAFGGGGRRPKKDNF